MTKPLALAGLLIGLTAAPGIHARLLTAADGRTIDAEVTGFEGTEKVTIKRADTGQTFTLRIDSFDERDQTALRNEAAEADKKAKVASAKALVLDLERVKFDTRREKQDIRLADGTTRRDGITITEDDWGFSVTLRNTTMNPVEGLRGEYILFVKVDDPSRKTAARSENRLKRISGKLAFGPVPGGGRSIARTEPVVVRKTELAKGIIWTATDETKSRDTLEGVWLRVYQGDALVMESASPASLMSTETWADAKKR